MSADRKRFARQIQLAEIGEAGQAKLCAASVELTADGFARVVEARYVSGSGISIASTDTFPAGDVALPELGLRHRASCEVARGALFALAKLRAVLAS